MIGDYAPASNRGRSVPGIAALNRWLVNDALTLWADHGVDRIQGGFYERIGFDFAPIEAPRRARLVARQIYCFATAPSLGWSGPAAELVRHGVDFLTRHLVTVDGTVRMATSADGTVIKEGHDLYDYAFVLFGLAAADRYFPDGSARRLGKLVRDRLLAGFAHTEHGFLEPLPMKANPHMHLFEAFLAFEKVAGGQDPVWAQCADDIAALALERLIDPATGALSELFDEAWRPPSALDDRLVEPGHQLEWAWLLAHWSASRDRPDGHAAALRLANIGEQVGVDPSRGIVMNGLDGTLVVRDRGARLWPQCERLKAWHALANHPMSDPATRYRAEAILPHAVAGLKRFLLDSPAGLWREVVNPNGSFVEEPVRASSLYHIVCALESVTGPLRWL